MVIRSLDIDTLVLKAGAHRSLEEGSCLEEAVSYIAGEPWSDHPKCVSPVLAAFGRAWNDGMRSDEERGALKQYITRQIGTAGDREADERRAWLATDWLVRVCAPAFLRLAKLDEHADKLAALQPIADARYAALAQEEINAAMAAAGDAARDAARAAARAAAWAAAGAAAGAAAMDAAGAAARDAARDAALDAAMDAAMDAALDAALDAAWDALEPTVLALQKSGHVLFTKMIDAEEVPTRWPELNIAGAGR